jgi:hypothetical protein
MSASARICFFLFGLLLLTSPLLAADAGSGQPDAGQQTNLIVAGLMAFVAVKFTIAGTLAYLWYRKSKYRKQKVILDA